MNPEENQTPNQPPEQPLLEESKPWYQALDKIWITIGVVIVVAAIGGYFWFTQKLILPPISPTPPPATQQPQVKDETKDWNTYVDLQDGYQIKYPSFFVISDYQNVRPGFIRGKKFKILDEDMPHLSIPVYGNPSLLPMEEWYTTTLADKEFAYPDSSTRSITQTTVDGVSSLEVRSNFLEHTMLRTFVPKGDKVFALETFAPDTVEIPDLYFLMLETFTVFTPIDTSNWKTYRNEEYGYTLHFPAGFLVIDTNNTAVLAQSDTLPLDVKEMLTRFVEEDDIFGISDATILIMEVVGEDRLIYTLSAHPNTDSDNYNNFIKKAKENNKRYDLDAQITEVAIGMDKIKGTQIIVEVINGGTGYNAVFDHNEYYFTFDFTDPQVEKSEEYIMLYQNILNSFYFID